MAGRPRRRAREAAERGELAQFPEPPKPVSEMTPAERDAYTRSLRRALRDEDVRLGRRPPRTMREMEIWHEALAGKEEEAARRIARAEGRRQLARAEQAEPAPE